jgi:hypothetical protein
MTRHLAQSPIARGAVTACPTFAWWIWDDSEPVRRTARRQ